MKDLLNQIKRFQDLKDITGTSKSSSYSVTLSFNPWTDVVQVEFGGYDCGDWSRHEYMSTTRDKLIEDLTKKVDEAVEKVTEYSQEIDEE